MPIDYKNEIIFIHIPRNAGTSILRSFKMNYIGHHNWDDYKRLNSYWMINKYKKFCVFRDPLKRFISSYNYASMEKSFWHPDIAGIHKDYDICKKLDINGIARLLERGVELWHESWIPQNYWIQGLDDILILKYENISQDIQKVYPNASLNYDNVSEELSHNITDYTKQFIKEFYKKDYEIWEKLLSSNGTKTKR